MNYRQADLRRVAYLDSQASDAQFLDRWAAAYNLTRTIPDDNRFDMDWWGGPRAESACGTAACVAGHAMLHPWFRRRGVLRGCSIESEGMTFENFEFFGTEEGEYCGGSPFSPSACSDALARPTTELTPALVAQVIRAWMLRTWTEKEVDAAIKAHKHVVYDVDAVHRNAPRNNQKAAKHG